MSEFSISKLLKLLLVGSIILFFPITQIQSQTENIWFEEVTEQVGMIHTGQTFGSSWGDFNGDGLPDLWVSNHYVKPSLYINQGNGIFVNKISEIVSIDNSKADTHGAAWADFDNDGDQDLIQLVGRESDKGQGSNLLYVNNDRRLEDQAAIQGLDYPFGRGRTPLWFDYNNDGMIDILLATYNSSGFLAQTIASILQQDCTDWRLLICDGGSTDATGEMIEQYTRMHPDSRGSCELVAWGRQCERHRRAQ